tara:strand:+ start:277 stop:558 length:282 start_codon:yes stop_codon:yes gene_type:complete
MPYYDLEYRGARLKVEVDDQMRSYLYINGLQRDSQDAETLPTRCRLSSSVQTDYEWHEFIEAEIILNSSEITITLRANNATLGTESFNLQGKA